MEKICVQGMCVGVERIISRKSLKCVGCQKETERCVKLYQRQGSTETICAELSEN